MTGTILDYKKHCRLPFGAYVETHEENKPSNTLKERTRAAICLGPTANFRGGYKFLCLRTGRRITRKKILELPMPASVITSVEALTDQDKQEGSMEFTDRDGNTYDNLDDTNQPINGVAGVDTADETAHDEQEQEMAEMPGVPGTLVEDLEVEMPGVPETIAEDLEIPGVEPLENLEIPGVEPIENLEIPGVDTEEIDPDNMEMDLEAPEMGEAPEETTIPGVLTGPPPVQSGEEGDNEHDSNGPPPPLSPRSDYTSDSDD
jgi:hypothetical protein